MRERVRGRNHACQRNQARKDATCAHASRFWEIITVAKASREMIALSMEMLADQKRLYYGKKVTPTPSRVRVHSGPPSFRTGNETHLDKAI